MYQQNAYGLEELKLFMDPKKPGSKLPSGHMCMIDQITQITEEEGNFNRGIVRAEFEITPDKWFFDCHFPGDPVMPGCLGLDALWQLSGFFLAWSGHKGKGRALGVDKVEFFGEILPETNKVEYVIHVRRIIQKGITMIIADGEVYADGKHIYTAKKLRVALLTNQLEGAQ